MEDGPASEQGLFPDLHAYIHNYYINDEWKFTAGSDEDAQKQHPSQGSALSSRGRGRFSSWWICIKSRAHPSRLHQWNINL
jgi:hypothetical protein